MKLEETKERCNELMQKENEELKEDTRSRVIGCRDLAKKCEECALKECVGCEYSISDLSTTLKNFVSKDKIREKIEEIEKMANGNKIIENTIRYRIEMALLKKLLKEE